VAFDEAGSAVAKIGGDVYDRWCQYTEGPQGPVITCVEPGPAMGLAYVVDPRRWRRGFGTATLLAAMDTPDVADVVLFAAGIEADNIPSARCAAAAGFGSPHDRSGLGRHHLPRSAARTSCLVAAVAAVTNQSLMP
jgi:RimJ/RimL family protein N-acetyltransferase